MYSSMPTCNSTSTVIKMIMSQVITGKQKRDVDLVSQGEQLEVSAYPKVEDDIIPPEVDKA